MRNVLWSWGGHLVFIVSGFLLPRAIDHAAGKELLGVWDFVWSIVSYFSLIQFGVSSSVNRYVAKYMASEQFEDLNCAMSSVLCLQMMAGLVMLLLTVVTVGVMPLMWEARLGGLVRDAQWLVFYLGLGTGIGFGFGVFTGVLTGCHRWDLYNGILSTMQALCVGGMLVSLKLYGSLQAMGIVSLSAVTLQVMTSAVVAHRVCPHLKLRFWYVRRSVMLTMLGFGGKTFLNGLSRAFLYQTSAVLMVTYLGPAALAVYNRPLALINHTRVFVGKFANTLTPLASEMKASSGNKALQDLTIRMARVGAALALPPVIFLSVMGGPVLMLWMGPDYRNAVLPVILACGHLWAVANLPLQTILTGMNAHGRAAVASAISAAVCAAVCWVAVGLCGGGRYSVAMCVGITVTLADGAYVALYTCHLLRLPFWAFLRNVWVRPLACVSPFALWLLMARGVFSPVYALLWGAAGGGIILCALYWRWILDSAIRLRIRRYCVQSLAFPSSRRRLGTRERVGRQ